MSFYVLDTDHLSLLQRGNEAIHQHLLAVPPTEIAITVVTLEEQLRGWLALINKANSGEQRIKAYQRLQAFTTTAAALTILPYTEPADQLFEQFRKAKIRLGSQDLRIACIVLANQAVLLTRNHKDFCQVAGLQIADWST